MNSTFDGSDQFGNPPHRPRRLLAGLSGLLGLGFALMLAATPESALAANHGAGIFKVPVGPLGTPRAEVGQNITASIKVQNLDDFGDSLTIGSITDAVHHASGHVLSPNLIPGSISLLAGSAFLSNNMVVLPKKFDFVVVTHIYPVLPGDAARTNLLDDAIALGIDNHNGTNISPPTLVPQPFVVTFPGQVQMVTPCITVTKTC